MRVLLLAVALCLCFSLASAIYEACNTPSGTGFCQDTGAACGGRFISGYCAGPANIKCCVASCSSGGKSGNCIPTSSCSGSVVSGLCKGPNNIKCCIPNSGGGGDGSGSGAKWLTRAGSYTVEKLDRTGRRAALSFTQRVDKFVIHTIEGRWPSNGDWEVGTRVLDGNKYWPHFIVARDNSGRVRIGQYLPLDVGGYALETGNRDGCIQVEVGAKADKPFTANDAGLTAAVRALFHAVAGVTGIPISVDPRVRFTSNGAWGENAPQRLSASVFRSVRGLVGHQHVYGNSHWDPGAINPKLLL